MRVITFSSRYGHACSSNRTFLLFLIFFVVFIGTAEASFDTGPPSPPSIDHSSRGYSAFGDSGGSQFFTGDLPPNYEYFRQINNPPSCVSGFRVGTGDNGIDGGLSVVFQKYSSGNLQNYQDAIMNNWQSSGAEWYSLSPGETPSGWPGDYWYNVPQDTGIPWGTQTGTPQGYQYGFYDPATGDTAYYDPATDTWFNAQSGGYPADWNSPVATWYPVQVGSPTGTPPDSWYNTPQDTGMQGDTQTGTSQGYLYGLYDPATGDMAYYDPATNTWFNARSGGYPSDWSSSGATWYSMPAGSPTGSSLDTWYMDTQTGDMPYYWNSPGSEWYSIQVGSPTGSSLDAWYNVPEGTGIPPMGQTYYWRVDELPESSGDTGTGTGDWTQSQGPAADQNWYTYSWGPSQSQYNGWYFAEGPVTPGFDSYIMVQNPDAGAAWYDFQLGSQEGGNPLESWYDVPGDTGIPPMGQTYYWRVDELPDSSGDTGTGTGDWAQSQSPAPNQNWYFVQYNNPTGSPIDSWYTGGPSYPDVQAGDFASEPDLSGSSSQAGTQTGSWQPSVVGYYNPATGEVYAYDPASGQLFGSQFGDFNLDLISNTIPAQVRNAEPLSTAEIQKLRELATLFYGFSEAAHYRQSTPKETEAEVERIVNDFLTTNSPDEVRETLKKYEDTLNNLKSEAEKLKNKAGTG